MVGIVVFVVMVWIAAKVFMAVKGKAEAKAAAKVAAERKAGEVNWKAINWNAGKVEKPVAPPWYRGREFWKWMLIAAGVAAAMAMAK